MMEVTWFEDLKEYVPVTLTLDQAGEFYHYTCACGYQANVSRGDYERLAAFGG